MSLASQIVIAKNSILMEYRRRRNQEGDFGKFFSLFLNRITIVFFISSVAKRH